MPSADWEPDEEATKDLLQRISPQLKAVYGKTADKANREHDLGLDWDFLDENARKYAAERGAELVGKKLVDGVLVDNPSAHWAISETTREAVNDLLVEALTAGWSVEEFSAWLESGGMFSQARATMISRTEMALAMNRGRTDSYREAGYEYVYVDDGDYDEACQQANGEVWTLDEADENPLEHPSCLRSFRPATREEAADEAGRRSTEEEDVAA